MSSLRLPTKNYCSVSLYYSVSHIHRSRKAIFMFKFEEIKSKDQRCNMHKQIKPLSGN